MGSQRFIFLFLVQRARFNAPPLQLTPQFARPIFFRAGHEHLSARMMGAFEEWEQSTAAFGVEFARAVVRKAALVQGRLKDATLAARHGP